MVRAISEHHTIVAVAVAIIAGVTVVVGVESWNSVVFKASCSGSICWLVCSRVRIPIAAWFVSVRSLIIIAIAIADESPIATVTITIIIIAPPCIIKAVTNESPAILVVIVLPDGSDFSPANVFGFEDSALVV